MTALGITMMVLAGISDATISIIYYNNHRHFGICKQYAYINVAVGMAGAIIAYIGYFG